MGYAGEKAQVLMRVHFRSHAVDISNFSAKKCEKEILIFPARYLFVQGSEKIAEDVTVIDLVEEKNTPSMLLGIEIPKWTAAKVKQVEKDEGGGGRKEEGEEVWKNILLR
jgi:hypothetical protein